jgi:hypothetical protein
MFSDKQIQELLELFEREFGLEVSPEEACEYALRFLDLLVITYKESDEQLKESPPEKKKEPQSRSG